MKKIDWWQTGFRIVPIVVLISLRLLRVGRTDWMVDLMLLAGWVLGLLIVDIEKYPLQKYIKGLNINPARPAVRNVLTCVVITVVGLWVISSSIGAIGWTMVWAVGVRLWSELWKEKNYEKWYWIFDRKFSVKQHQVFMIVWAVVLLFQLNQLVWR